MYIFRTYNIYSFNLHSFAGIVLPSTVVHMIRVHCTDSAANITSHIYRRYCVWNMRVTLQRERPVRNWGNLFGFRKCANAHEYRTRWWKWVFVCWNWWTNVWNSEHTAVAGELKRFGQLHHLDKAYSSKCRSSIQIFWMDSFWIEIQVFYSP